MDSNFRLSAEIVKGVRVQRSCKSRFLQWLVFRGVVGLAILSGLPSLGFSQTYVLQKKTFVSAPTRLDWTFATTRRNLVNVSDDLVGAEYDSKKQSYLLYGPDGQSAGQSQLPLILHLSNKGRSEGWHYWKKFCQENNVCFVEPYEAGADQPFARRVRIILDVLDDVRQRHQIDPHRTYVTGLGEGAHLACEIAYALPECFGGIIAIMGGEAPPVPPWMQRRIAERLSVAFVSIKRGKAATFADVVFHPMAVACGIDSIHKQHYEINSKFPGYDLLYEMFHRMEQGVFRRRSVAVEYPSTCLQVDGPFSRELQAKHVLAEARKRLANDAEAYAGVCELEGLLQRWPDLPEAKSAHEIQLELAAKSNRHWERVISDNKRAIQGIAIHALMHVHWKYYGIKSDVRLLNRAGARKNYIEDYQVMRWDEPAIVAQGALQNLARFDRRAIALKRRMGAMISFDDYGQVRKIDLGGTRVTAKQLRTIKKQIQGIERVQAVELSSAVMKDSALSEVASLSNLRALNLNHVAITDRSILHLKQLRQLQHLGLAFTDVSHLKHLPLSQELLRLNLGGSKTGNSALKHLANFTELEHLSIFSSQVTNAGIPYLVNLKSLQFLNLAATKIDDSCCKSLSRIQSLAELVLDGTQVSDDGLEDLMGLSNLRHLSLEGLQITDAGINSLEALQQLETVNVVDTQVTALGVTELKSMLPECKIQWNGDRTNYRANEKIQRAIDRRNASEMEVRRFSLRELQRKLLGVCHSSGE